MTTQYTGYGDQFQASVVIFGDGTTKTFTIDLSMPPFGINFLSAPPVSVSAFDQHDSPVKLRSTTLTQGKLVLTFVNPLPVTNWDYTSGQYGLPRSRIDMYFLYAV